MRKTKDVTKFDLDWQCFRVSLKNIKNVEDKCLKAREFFDNNRSFQNWERVVNYLEGLSFGYKRSNAQAVEYILQEILSYGDQNDYDKISDKPYKTWTQSELESCYKDNIQRFKKFCSNGYLHRELYEFVKSFDFADLELIEKYKREACEKKNSHKFFF